MHAAATASGWAFTSMTTMSAPAAPRAPSRSRRPGPRPRSSSGPAGHRRRRRRGHSIRMCCARYAGSPSLPIRSSWVSSQSIDSSPSASIGSKSRRDPSSPTSRQQRDGRDQSVDGSLLEHELVLELVGHAFSDADPVEPLQVGSLLEVDDALDQLLGVTHLLDRIVVGALGEVRVAPVVSHLGVDEVRARRRQFRCEQIRQRLHHLRTSLHQPPPRRHRTSRAAAQESPAAENSPGEHCGAESRSLPQRGSGRRTTGRRRTARR